MNVGRVIPMLLLALLSAGCSTIAHTPKDYELEEAWPTVPTSAPVTVRSTSTPTERFTIKLAGQSMSVDLQEYSDALVQRVRDALSSQGATLAPDAPAVIEVEVVYVNILPQMRNHCVVDFTVRTGSGYVRGHQARHESSNPQKACDAALSRAAFELLADKKIQSYLAGSP